MFDNKQDKEIKNIFLHLNGWKYSRSTNDGISYWEVVFKNELDKSVNKDILAQTVYDLEFKPAVQVHNRDNKTLFFGLYQQHIIDKIEAEKMSA